MGHPSPARKKMAVPKRKREDAVADVMTAAENNRLDLIPSDTVDEILATMKSIRLDLAFLHKSLATTDDDDELPDRLNPKLQEAARYFDSDAGMEDLKQAIRDLNLLGIAAGGPPPLPVATTGPASPTVLSRLAELEARIEEFEVKHGALYSRVGVLEDGVGIDVVVGPSQARRR